MTFIARLWCLLVGGHRDIIVRDGSAVKARCMQCLRETPGWVYGTWAR
jgi:hypothetical protein